MKSQSQVTVLLKDTETQTAVETFSSEQFFSTKKKKKLLHSKQIYSHNS